MTNEIRRHSFEPGAMSIIQMGEELIGNPSTAINELVKNAYDADSNSCRVYFNYNDNPTLSYAIIIDDGNGMKENTLFGEWLQPSVSTKRKPGAKSEIYKRNFLGSKGIGRLAAMALGRYITVITKTVENSLYSWITVDREAFKEEILLSKINFPGDIIKNYLSLFSDPEITSTRQLADNIVLVKTLKDNHLDRLNKGTIVVIEHLDDSVLATLKDDFIQLTELEGIGLKDTEFYKSLANLITPLHLSSKIQQELFDKKIIKNITETSQIANEFQIEFGVNLLPDQNQGTIDWLKIEDVPILSVFDYRVFGLVRKDGTVKGSFTFNRLEGDTHEEPFEISREVINDSEADAQEGNTGQTGKIIPRTQIGEYYFDIRVYDIGENENLDKLRRLSGFKSSRDFRISFGKFQGLRVSKNGFGVKPYGDEADDWIGLSKARVQDPGHTINTNQIIGNIFFFSPENDKLQEKTNREGFMENVAFSEVKRTLKVIFKNIGVRRYNFRLLHGLGRIPSKHTRPDFQKFLNEINRSINVDHIRRYSTIFVKNVTTSMDNLEESLSFSERLASLGNGIELVYHEMAQPLSILASTNDSMEMRKNDIKNEVRDKFILDLSDLKNSTDVLIELRKSLQPAIGISRKKKFKPYYTFLKVCNLFKADFKNAGISIKPDNFNTGFPEKEFEIDTQEYAFWIAFLNIVNNAVYWIKKSERRGEIRFQVEDNSIVVSNSGPRIQENIISYIFEYGVTSRQEKNATGLGLTFTRNILGRINWEITAENRDNGPAFIMKEGKIG
jgi:hypothetical protein